MPLALSACKYMKNIKKHKKHNSASYVFICLSTKSVQAKNLPGHFQKNIKTEIHNIWSCRKRKIESDFNMFSRSKITSFQNIMTLPKYLSYGEDNCFSFFLKFVLLQFKFIPAEFKYCRDSNGQKIQFRTLTKTDARIHFTSYVFMYLCLPIWAPLPHMPPAGSLKVLRAHARWV